MYARQIFNYLAFCLILLVIILACSSDDNNPITPPLTSTPPIFTIQSISTPSKMQTSSNKMVKEAVTLLSNCQNFKGGGCCFAPDENAKNLEMTSENSNQWRYTWVNGSLSPTLIITSQENLNKWELFLSGYDNQATYNNWKKMVAVQSDDSKNGHAYVYKPNTSTLRFDWSWTTNENGEFQLIKTCYDGKYKLVVNVSKVNSVELTKYEMNSNNQYEKTIKYLWQNSGTGQWWTYENSIETDAGSW